MSHLRDDHRRVLSDLREFEAEAAARPARGRPVRAAGTTKSLQRLLARLQRQFATHMNAEDAALYPALEEALPEIRPILAPLKSDHVELRAMAASLAAVLREPAAPDRDERVRVLWRDFAELLRIHIRKEEAAVFGLAERMLRAPQLAPIEARRFPRRATKPKPPVRKEGRR